MIMRVIFLTVISMLFFSFLKEGDKIEIGEKVNFNNKKYKNIDSKFISLESLIDKNGLIVVFSCNTCPFVVGNDNFPGWEKQYNDLHKEAKEAGLGFVLVNSNEGKRAGDDSFKEMKNHAKKLNYTMPYLVDENSWLADFLHAKTTPHVFVFNTLDELIYSGTIDNTWDTKRENDIFHLKKIISSVKTNTEITEKPTEPKGCSIKRIKVN
jgi:hypothetical protein